MKQLAARILNRTAEGDSDAGRSADLLFEFADGSEVLVTFWVDGSASAAKRDSADASWGAPSARITEMAS